MHPDGKFICFPMVNQHRTWLHHFRSVSGTVSYRHIFALQGKSYIIILCLKCIMFVTVNLQTTVYMINQHLFGRFAV